MQTIGVGSELFTRFPSLLKRQLLIFDHVEVGSLPEMIDESTFRSLNGLAPAQVSADLQWLHGQGLIRGLQNNREVLKWLEGLPRSGGGHLREADWVGRTVLGMHGDRV